MTLSTIIGAFITILFIVLQLVVIRLFNKKNILKLKDKFLSLITSFAISELILLILGYIIIIFSGGHFFPKISIIQAGLYYLSGISIWNEPPVIL